MIGCGVLWILLSLAALAFGWLDLTTAGVVWTWLGCFIPRVRPELQTRRGARTLVEIRLVRDQWLRIWVSGGKSSLQATDL